jgi:hypothetical protein
LHKGWQSTRIFVQLGKLGLSRIFEKSPPASCPGRRFLSSSAPPINTAWKHATILNIIVFEIAKASSKATGWVDNNISSLAPELEDAVPGPRREATAIENVVEFKQVTFVEPDSSNLHG